MMRMSSSTICSSISGQSLFTAGIGGCGGGRSAISGQAGRGRPGDGGVAGMGSGGRCGLKEECPRAWIWSRWRLGARVCLAHSLVSRRHRFFGGGLGPGRGIGTAGRRRRDLGRDGDGGGGGGGGGLLDVRGMGGGPRTYPGGVTKWQWKRMQEKKKRRIELSRIDRMKKEGQPPPYLWDPTRKEREEFYKTMRSGSRRREAMESRNRGAAAGASAKVAQKPFRGERVRGEEEEEEEESVWGDSQAAAAMSILRNDRGAGSARGAQRWGRGGEAEWDGAAAAGRRVSDDYGYGGARRKGGGEGGGGLNRMTRLERYLQQTKGSSRRFTSSGKEDDDDFSEDGGGGAGGGEAEGRYDDDDWEENMMNGWGRSSGGGSYSGIYGRGERIDQRSRVDETTLGFDDEEDSGVSRGSSLQDRVERGPSRSPVGRGGGGRWGGVSEWGRGRGTGGGSAGRGLSGRGSEARRMVKGAPPPAVAAGDGRDPSSRDFGKGDTRQGWSEGRKEGRASELFDIFADEEESEEEEEGGEVNEYDEGDWWASLTAAGVKSGLSPRTTLRRAPAAAVVIKEPWEREEYWRVYGGPSKEEVWARMQAQYNKDVPEDIRETPDPLRAARRKFKGMKVPKLVLVSGKGQLLPWFDRGEEETIGLGAGKKRDDLRSSSVPKGREDREASAADGGAGFARREGKEGGSSRHRTSADDDRQSEGGRQTATRAQSAAMSEHLLSQTKFDALDLSEATVRALTDLGCDHSSLLQEAAIPSLMAGKDLLVGGSAGQGKRLSYLIPAVEMAGRVVAAKKAIKKVETEEEGEGESEEKQGGAENDKHVVVLIVTPTRDSVQAIWGVAAALTADNPQVSLQTIIGGSRVNGEQSRLLYEPCSILIASAGRLLDHLQNTVRFPERLSNLKLLVLDETAELVRLGLRPLIDSILRYLPPSSGGRRQSCMFSSTLPPQIFSLVHGTLRPDHEVLDMVRAPLSDADSPAASAAAADQVFQEYMVVRLEDHLTVLYQMLRLHMEEEEHNFKVVVFCVSMSVTLMMTELFQALGLPAVALHPRLARPDRIKIANEFRLGTRTILVSSDNTARGDYPGVTLVVQVGMPVNRDQYLVRAKRSDKSQGTSLLLLYPFEKFFLGYLRDLALEECEPMPIDPFSEDKISKTLKGVDINARMRAYQDFLGYYKNHRDLVWDKTTLVQNANVYSKAIGFEDPPVLSLRVALALGLSKVKGLRVADIY